MLVAAVLLLAATTAAIELTWATRVLPSFGELGQTAGRAGRMVMRARVSEWAKEKAMRLMSMRMMGQSLRGAGLLIIVASPFLAVSLLDTLMPFGLGRAYGDWPTRLVLLFVSIAYVMVRRRFRRPAAKKAPSAGFERTWQRIALGNPAVLDMTFDMERSGFKPWPDAAAAPIFVAGLPRAGTTVLTRLLHEQHGLASLVYRDLPFPLAPNGWAALSAKLGRHVERAERGHGDGVFHDLDSAEAIEEVFWRHHEGQRFSSPKGLSTIAPLPETMTAFRDYVGLVRRRHDGARYLSKNNANVLRLPALAETFPDAILLHPFRDPLQQSLSLLRQHRQALQSAAEDPFRAEFMSLMGHHEFGADQRPYLFAGHPPADGDRDHIDYWLRLWISVHTALLAQPEHVRGQQVFLDYDALCADAPAQADALAASLGLDSLALDDLHPAPWRAVGGANRLLLARALVIHVRLRARSLNGAFLPAAQRVRASA